MQERPSPISLAKDSESLSNFFCGCIFSGVVHLNCQIERVCRFFFQAFIISLSLCCLSVVVQVFWTSISCPDLFVLKDHQSSWISEVISALQVKWESSHPQTVPPSKNIQIVDTGSNFSPLQRETELEVFSHSVHVGPGGRGNHKWVCASSNLHLCS